MNQPRPALVLRPAHIKRQDRHRDGLPVLFEQPLVIDIVPRLRGFDILLGHAATRCVGPVEISPRSNV